jgi:glycyl-tRNA synthetase alpha subunit
MEHSAPATHCLLLSHSLLLLHVLQARRMLEKRLPVPAYDMLLKCSHAFNVLDARGAVGVTERADCFARMRALAREVTGGFVQLVCGLLRQFSACFTD